MTKVSSKTGKTGPSWDPYGYEMIYVTRPDGTYIEWLSCSLRGEVLTVDGEDVASIPSYRASEEQKSNFDLLFEKAVGCSPYFLTKALRRMEYERQADCPDMGGYYGYYL